ncbi:MAG: AAA family ATPase [Myxococcales bacterium]|nr:AAA family ATPase [Myxococcales bacterium]
MKTPCFIVIEGLDGCGKSTLTRLLAQRLHAEALATPLASFPAEARRAAERMCHDDPLARMLFYASTVAAASTRTRELLASGQSVVMDRYWLSTLTYHRFMGVTCELPELESALLPADLTVFLNVSTETRKSRLHERGALLDHDRMTLRPGAGERLAELYRACSHRAVTGRYLEIAADSLAPEELATRVAVEVVRAGEELR